MKMKTSRGKISVGQEIISVDFNFFIDFFIVFFRSGTVDIHEREGKNIKRFNFVTEVYEKWAVNDLANLALRVDSKRPQIMEGGGAEWK